MDIFELLFGAPFLDWIALFVLIFLCQRLHDAIKDWRKPRG